MEIDINRKFLRDHYTVGELSINGKFLCDTMEPRAIDWKVEKKVKGLTAIPEGRYPVVLAYSSKWKQEMPYLMNVPHFSGIQIHKGNVATYPDGTPGDSQGCILVGYNNAVGRLCSSTKAFNQLLSRLWRAFEKGDPVWVTIHSKKGWTYAG